MRLAGADVINPFSQQWIESTRRSAARMEAGFDSTRVASSHGFLRGLHISHAGGARCCSLAGTPRRRGRRGGSRGRSVEAPQHPIFVKSARHDAPY